MQNKKIIRKKYYIYRKKKYFEIEHNFFNPLIKLIKKKYKNKYINLSSYYPASHEVNVTKLMDKDNVNEIKILLPVLKGRSLMQFYRWKKYDILQINQFGMLEPGNSLNHIVPDIMLVPLLAYDNHKNRLGYGGGFYDRYLNKYLKNHKNILSIGVAFSFQKHDKLPVFNKDVKLNYILTEKGIF